MAKKVKEVPTVKELSVTEYVQYRHDNDQRGSRQYVLKCINTNKKLPAVSSSKKVGNHWNLTVDTEYYKKLSMQA